jgi:hypothetical protein
MRTRLRNTGDLAQREWFSSIRSPVPDVTYPQMSSRQTILSRVCGGVCVTSRKGFRLDELIYWHRIYTTRDYRQYSAITELHNLQFTVTYALGFSVFISRILATDSIIISLSLQISHELFFAQPNSFLAIILPTANSIQFLCSQAHIPAGWRLETRLFSAELFFIATLHGPRREHNLFIIGKACLHRRCIAAEVTRLWLAYSLQRECVYRVVTQPCTCILTSLFRLWGVMSQYPDYVTYLHNTYNCVCWRD